MRAINEDEAKLLKKEACNSYCGYMKSKKVGSWPLVVEPRDFVITNHHEIYEDGSIVMVAFSD